MESPKILIFGERRFTDNYMNCEAVKLLIGEIDDKSTAFF